MKTYGENIMKDVKKHPIAVAFLIALFLSPNAGWASGLTTYEQGQPSIGTANVGQAAYAEDASIAYYNPAGMTNIERSEVLMGQQLMVYTAKFKTDSNIQNAYTGSDGGNSGMALLGGGLYVVQKLFKGRAAAGLALNAPAGLGNSYEYGWKGRYAVQEAMIAVANINPSLAFKVTDWFSVGAGLSVYYGMLKQEAAIFNPPAVALAPLAITPNQDGSLKVTATDWRVGYNLGALIEPKKGTRIGVAYRSQVNFVFKGKAEINGLGGVLQAAGVSDSPRMAITLPIARSIMVSGYHEFTPKWAGLIDVGWQNWSSFQSQKIHFPNATVDINMDWKDTYRLGLGAHYKATDRLMLKAGFSYDSDPTSLANRLVTMPAAEAWRYGIGFDWKHNKNIVISLNYEFVDMGRARIDKDLQPIVIDPPGASVGPTTIFPGRQFDGEYNQFINMIGLSFRWKFGKGEPDSKPEKAAVNKLSLNS